VTQYLTIFIRMLVISLWVLILVRVLLSWIDPTMRTSVGRAVYGMTEPILAPVRRFVPQTGMFDLSPLIVLLALGVVLRLVL
jgi:YggT family protein